MIHLQSPTGGGLFQARRRLAVEAERAEIDRLRRELADGMERLRQEHLVSILEDALALAKTGDLVGAYHRARCAVTCGRPRR